MKEVHHLHHQYLHLTHVPTRHWCVPRPATKIQRHVIEQPSAI